MLKENPPQKRWIRKRWHDRGDSTFTPIGKQADDLDDRQKSGKLPRLTAVIARVQVIQAYDGILTGPLPAQFTWQPWTREYFVMSVSRQRLIIPDAVKAPSGSEYDETIRGLNAIPDIWKERHKPCGHELPVIGYYMMLSTGTKSIAFRIHCPYCWRVRTIATWEQRANFIRKV